MDVKVFDLLERLMLGPGGPAAKGCYLWALLRMAI